MEIKMCVYCENVTLTDSWCGTHTTAREDAYYKCGKDHYVDGDIEDLEGWALKAMKCPDYELKKSIIKSLEK